MYIQRQRKNLKPCLSLQRSHSNNLKASLRRFRFRKHIHVLYKLLSSVLLDSTYKTASSQYRITQAVQATPARTPILFDLYSVRVDPFPDHIYPQLRALKRATTKAHRRRQMEPLHWDSGFRPDRPFEHIQNNFMLPLRPPPRPHQARYRDQVPTRYYLEQAAFYTENHGPDPFATEPKAIQPGPLKVLVLKFQTVLSRVVSPGLNLFPSTVSRLLPLSQIIVTLVPRFLLEKICSLVGSVEWETLLALGIAFQLVNLLPGMSGQVLADGYGGGGGAPPAYTIYVQAGRVIGTGPVLAGSL
jgi:hypothetical protein